MTAGLTPEEATKVLVAGYFARKFRRHRARARLVARVTVVVWWAVSLSLLALGVGPLPGLIVWACATVCAAAATVVAWWYVRADAARYGYEWATWCLAGDRRYVGYVDPPPPGGWRFVDTLGDRASRVRSRFREEYGAGLGLPGCEPPDDPVWYAVRELDPDR